MSKKGLVAIIVILTIMVFSLGTYVAYDKFIKPNSVKEVKKDEGKSNSKSSSDSSKIEVYDSEDYKYLHVPYIDLKSDEGKRLNKEIKDFVSDYEDTKEFTDNCQVTYQTFENENIISIIIKKDTPSSSTNYYKSINIDTKTGKEVDNKYLLDMKNIDENYIPGMLLEVYDNQAEENGNLEDLRRMPSQGDEFTSVYDATKNNIENNKLDDYVMYLNKKDELIVVVEVYFYAGPEKGNVLMNLNTNLYEK